MTISEDHHLHPHLPHFLNNLVYIALLLKFILAPSALLDGLPFSSSPARIEPKAQALRGRPCSSVRLIADVGWYKKAAH